MVGRIKKFPYTLQTIKESVNSPGVSQGVSHPIKIFALSFQWSVNSPLTVGDFGKRQGEKGLTTWVRL